MFGPYHRKHNEKTQSDETVILQVETGEIWGGTSRWSDIPTVRAYARPIPLEVKGIEFTTAICPIGQSPIHVKWPLGGAGVLHRQSGLNDYACITATIRVCT